MLIGISGKIGSGKDAIGKIIQCLVNNISLENTIKYVQDPHWVWTFNYPIKKFAASLKDIVCILLGCTREQLEDREFKEKMLGEEWWYIKHWYPANPNHDKVFKLIPYVGFDSRVFDGDDCCMWEIIKLTPRKLLQLLGTNCGRDIIHPNIWCISLFNQYNRTLTKEDLKRLKSIWKNINTRCTNSNYIKSHKYKDIGIKNTFNSFEDFVLWSNYNGYTSKLTLDRKNGNKNYSKENCRWVTTALQGLNKKQYDNSNSKYKGVSKAYNNKTNPYLAQIQFKGIKENLGFYKTQEEAKKVYDKRFLELITQEEINSKKEQHQFPNWIITDVRFKNELKAIEDREGISIRVNRRFVTSILEDGQRISVERGILTGEEHLQLEKPHESETALDNAKFQYTIDNNGTIEELVNKVKEILIKEKVI